MNMKFFVVTAATLSSLHSQVNAQEPDSVKSLDEVVMTANKFPNKLSRTAKVITVITRAELEKSGGKDLSQVLTQQAGIYINGANSNPGKDKAVFLRGARVDHTLIMIDGVPVYDPSGVGGNFDIRNLAVDNIERIEILKGSQSTLYGSDAIAGVINIITRRTAESPLDAYGVMSYGSNNTFKTHLGLSGKSGNVDYTLNQSYFDSQGINEATSNAPITDEDEYRQNNMYGSIGIQAWKQVRIEPYARFSKSIGNIDQGAFTDERDYTYKQNSIQAGFRNEISFSKTRLHINYNYNHINREYVDDSVQSRNGFDIYVQGKYKGAEHFGDVYAHIPVTNNLRVTTGVDYRRSHSDQDFLSISSFGPFQSKNTRDSLHQDQLGIYVSAAYELKKGFTIEAGNRLNLHSEYGGHYVFNVDPSYLVNEQWKLFANLSSGYRTPSLYQLFSEIGNRDLKPERALTAEGGVQFFSKRKNFMARATVFNRNVNDVIFFQSNFPARSMYINQDEQEDNGAELETSLNLRKTTFKLIYNYVTGEITTKNGSTDTTYFNLLRRPKHNLGFTAGHQFNDRIYVSSNFFYVGKRQDAYFDMTTFQTVNVNLNSYALWDVYFEYQLLRNKLKLFVDLRNLTDNKYVEAVGFNTLGFNGNGGVRFRL